MILLVASCVCLLLGELAARCLFPQFNPSAQLKFQVMPGPFALGPAELTLRHASPKGDFDVWMKFNQHGFRDSKDLRDSTEEDWFAVGDSFTMGYGEKEEERYTNLLERKLQNSGSHVRIFNIAIPGNFIDYFRLVKHAESKGAKIHHLIIGVCMDNDLNPNYSDGKSDWEWMQYRLANQAFQDSIQEWLRNHSALYLAMAFAIQSNPKGRELMQKLGWSKDLVALDANHKNEFNKKHIENARDALLEICSNREAIVLVIPSRRIWLADKEAEIKIHTMFVQLCREAHLNVIDALPVINKDANPLDSYFKYDSHWSPHGHAVGAEELFKVIQNRKQL